MAFERCVFEIPLVQLFTRYVMVWGGGWRLGYLVSRMNVER
jgi:hypothetical protein